MSQSYYSLWYHLVWSTKNRIPLIEKSWKWLLYNHIKEYCAIKEYHLDFINGTENHIHLLISPKPIFSISSIAQDIKRDSYFWVIDKGLASEHFNWQDGYGAFTVSKSMIEQVRNYIRNQEEHHKNQSFEQEIEFFKRQMK